MLSSLVKQPQIPKQKKSPKDESESFTNITQQLSKIRKNLGIDSPDKQPSQKNSSIAQPAQSSQYFKTPSEDSQRLDIDHNTFGKQLEAQQKESYKSNTILHSETDQNRFPSRQAQNQNHFNNDWSDRLLSEKQESPSKNQQFQDSQFNAQQFSELKIQKQISTLEGQLTYLKSLNPDKPSASFFADEYIRNIQELEQKNTAVMIELEYQKSQVNFVTNQMHSTERQLTIKVEQLTHELVLKEQQLEKSQQTVEKLMKSSNIGQGIQEYVILLQKDLQLAQNELQSEIFRKNQKGRQDDKNLLDYTKLEKNIKKEFEKLYKDEIKELRHIINLGEIPKITKNAKSIKDTRKNEFSLEERNRELEQRVFDLEWQLKSQKMGSGLQVLNEGSVKQLFESRIYNLRLGLKQMKQKIETLYSFFSDTLQSLKREGEVLKKQLLKDQGRLKRQFEKIILQLTEAFDNEKNILLKKIDQLSGKR